MTNLAVVQPRSDADLMPVMRSSFYPGASDDSIAMALAYCRASGLDPMQKPVHIVPMWDKNSRVMRDVIMPGIGLYRTQAARSGQLAGITEPEFGADVSEEIGGQKVTYPAWCRVTVKRRLPTGEIAEFTATERWRENYAVRGGKDQSIAPNTMWAKRPYGQLAKCAQAQALRMAFPEMVGAQPTADEMEGKEVEATVIETKPAAKPTAYPADAFAKNLPKWTEAIADGRLTANDVIARAESKAPLSDEQKAAIRAAEVVEVVEDAS